MNFDSINDPIKLSQKVELSDFDLNIVRIISEKPGLNAKQILEELIQIFDNATIDMVKNSLKRKLIDICEFRGSKKNGGQYLKNQ